MHRSRAGYRLGDNSLSECSGLITRLEPGSGMWPIQIQSASHQPIKSLPGAPWDTTSLKQVDANTFTFESKKTGGTYIR
jgi:hypothetical protein